MTLFPPYVSVVIPAYNAAKVIAEALSSVAAQSLTDYEVIVVNDGSTDETELAVKEVCERKRLAAQVVSQPNGGVARARNTGILRSRGRYVAFLDADDTWYPAKLERAKAFFETHPEVDLLSHHLMIVRDGHPVRVTKTGPYTCFEDLLYRRNKVWTSAVVVDAAKLKAGELFSERRDFAGVEDYDLWLRLSKVMTFGYLDEVQGTYRISADGFMQNIESHTEHVLNVLEHHFASEPGQSIAKNRRRADAIRFGGVQWQRIGKFAEARRYYWNALRRYPFNLLTWGLMASSFLPQSWMPRRFGSLL